MKSLASNLVLKAVHQHGLTGSIEDDRIIVDSGALILEAEVFEKNKEAVLIVFEVYATSPQLNGQYIVESFAGWGKDTEAAINDAFMKFLVGSFHVLIESLVHHKCNSEQVDVKQWVNKNKTWEMYIGPTVISHSDESLLSNTYDSFANELKVLFAKKNLAEPAWIRVFVASFKGELAAVEVLLNNETWHEAQDLLRTQPWQHSQNYESVRQFMVALPK